MGADMFPGQEQRLLRRNWGQTGTTLALQLKSGYILVQVTMASVSNSSPGETLQPNLNTSSI